MMKGYLFTCDKLSQKAQSLIRPHLRSHSRAAAPPKHPHACTHRPHTAPTTTTPCSSNSTTIPHRIQQIQTGATATAKDEPAHHAKHATQGAPWGTCRQLRCSRRPCMFAHTWHLTALSSKCFLLFTVIVFSTKIQRVAPS